MPVKDDTPHLRLRIEPKLLARLEKSREKSGRTLTGEISHRLEQSFQREDTEALIERTAEKAAGALMSHLQHHQHFIPKLTSEIERLSGVDPNKPKGGKS